MSSLNGQYSLPLIGGVVQQQRLVVPHEVIIGIKSYRQACRLAFKLRRRGVTQRVLCEAAGLYAPHVSDYFSVHANRRELPARFIGAVSAVLGNTVIGQWVNQDCHLTVLEEMQATRRAAKAA
ncbi:MAG: hypothetical protein ABI605_10975 [Rhizobacter sp.]